MMHNALESTITVPEEVMECLNRVNERISKLEVTEFIEDGLYCPAMHILKEKGKMLRPVLVFMGGIYIGHQNPDDFVDIAIAVELLHTSSLIHDDIIDKDIRRRGVESTHVRYGNELALLAGDALISSAIQRISGYGKRLISIMARTAMEMTAGEALDFRFQRSGTVPSLSEYNRIAYLKSASLIRTSASVAASYKTPEDESALGEFGKNFGMAFQIRDDVYDFIDGIEGNKSSSRPNVIKSIMKSAVSEKEAIMKSVEMNNEYIMSGLNALDEDRRHIFEKYSDMAMLNRENLL